MRYFTNSKFAVPKSAEARLARKCLKANRGRNLFIVSAIVLTTLLITSVFTIAFSINRSMELAEMKTSGSDFHGSFKYLTPEEADKLAQDHSIKAYGKSVLVGQATNDVFRDGPIEIDQVDAMTAKHNFIHLLAGNLPQLENELVMNTWSLDLLGVPHKVGAQVELKMDINGMEQFHTFHLSGYYEADRYLSMSGQALVSEAFVENYLSTINPENTRLSGSNVNTTTLYVMINNSFHIENKLKEVLLHSGLQVPYGVNWAYTSVGMFDSATKIFPYAGLVLLTMASGYLLIYNIFYISVVRDIRFYGLLKAIGTTPRQLRKMVVIQANKLYLIGMPIGLIMGYGAGCWLTPMMNSFSSDPITTSYSFSPVIVVGAAVFSYLTVRIAAAKPGRTAARISPVEAVKYTGISGGKRKVKRSSRGAKLSRMALSNLLRYKKKLLLMVASLSLSFMLFSIIYTVISSLDLNKYLSSSISGDIVIKEAGSNSRFAGVTALSQDICETLGQIEGVQSVDKVYYKDEQYKLTGLIKGVLEPLAAKEDPRRPAMTSILNNGFIDLQLHGLDPGWYGVIQPGDIIEGKFDPKRFATDDYILISEALLDGDNVTAYYHPGDRIRLDSLGREYEIMAVLDTDALYAAGTPFFTAGGFKVFLPADEFARRMAEPSILSATLHIDSSKLEQVQGRVDSFIASHPELTMKSREDYKKEMADYVRIFKIAGYGLSLIIALIGILNYINTTITGIFSRQRELVVLESVGMTRKQLRRMLLYEGFYGIGVVMLFMVSIGMYLTYLVAKGLADNLAFTKFHLSFWPLAVAIPLVIINLFVTLLAFRQFSRQSIVERLRKAES